MSETKARNLILDAENRAETIKKEITLEAKEDAHRLRSEAEREVRERRSEIQKSERRLIQKEEERKIVGLKSQDIGCEFTMKRYIKDLVNRKNCEKTG